MGLFEKIVNVAEEATDKVTKAAGEAVEAVQKHETGEYFESAKKKVNEGIELGKMKVEEVKLNNELEKAKTALGSLVYVMHKTNEHNDELLEQYIQDVADIEAKLEALKADAAEEDTHAEATAEDMAAAAEEIAAEADAAAEEIKAEAEEEIDVSDIILTADDEKKDEE